MKSQVSDWKENQDKPLPLIKRVLFNTFQSSTMRLVAVWAAYVSGNLKITPIYLLILWRLFIHQDQKRIERKFNQESNNAVPKRNDRKLVISNVEPLPSWVYFPDNERCECLNKVIGYLWPMARPIVTKAIKSSIEPILNEALSAINLSHFQFRDNEMIQFVSGKVKLSTLGSATPRISGIRVYETHATPSEQVVVDIYIFFFSDEDIPFSISNNETLGTISDLQIRGCLRITIFPVATSLTRLVGGVEFTFLNQPRVDFDLKGFIDLMDVPGFNKSLRDTVSTVIQQKLIHPNKIVIKYDDTVRLEPSKFPDPVGLLRLNAVAATDLSGSNNFIFKSSNNPDPYVTITFGPKTQRSPTVENSVEPKWDFWADFIIDSFALDLISISIDDSKTSENLGQASLSLKVIEENTSFDSWIQLEGVVTGMLHVRATYHLLLSDPNLICSNDLPVLLEVRIVDVKNLLNPKKSTRYSVAHISVGDITQSSRPVPVDDPVFVEVFSFLIKSPKTDKLQVKLFDESGENCLGDTYFELKHLLQAENMEVIDEQANLNGANETSRLSVSMRLRSLKP